MADVRYWDSACFIAWFKEETGRYQTCGSILEAAQAGQVQIVTSAFTITEVLLPKGGTRLPAELRETVGQFFMRPEFLIVDVNRHLARAAQQYFWDRGVKPKDAIHVASAIYAGVPVFETYDDGLINLSGRLGGDPVLEVRPPMPHAGSESLSLFDESSEPN